MASVYLAMASSELPALTAALAALRDSLPALKVRLIVAFASVIFLLLSSISLFFSDQLLHAWPCRPHFHHYSPGRNRHLPFAGGALAAAPLELVCCQPFAIAGYHDYISRNVLARL